MDRRITTLNVESARFALDQHSLVSITDIDGTITYVNSKFCDVSGYSADELLGKKHNILNSAAQPKSYWQNMHETVLAGKVWKDEVRNRTKNGDYYWVDTTIVANFDDNNQVVGFTSIRTDITKQKKTIEQLAIAKQQAEAAKFALDQHSLVSITELDGTIIYVNELFIKVSGYSKQELIGRKHNILNSGNQPKAYWQKMYGTVLSGNVWHDEVRNRAKDGSYYWVDTTIVPNFNANLEVVGFTSIRTDITEQKENLLQIAIAKQQAEAAKFALDEHSLVSMTDLEGFILYVNQKFIEISGYSEKELIGRKHNILNSGNQPKAYWQKMHGTVLSGKVWRDEVRNRAKDGSYYWVDTTIVPNINQNNEIVGFTSIRTDITQQKNANYQLIEAKKQAELANQAKEDFLANMSHEIRTPMNGIHASLQLLSQQHMPVEQQELVNHSLFSSECLLSIINDILDFSKIESGALELEKIRFSIKDTVESAVSDILTKVNKDKVNLTYSLSKELKLYWNGDPIKIKQILLNLLSNSVKFTEAGKITLIVSASQDEEHASGITIRVSDTGIGMSKQAMRHIFTRFSQADTSITRKYGGTGLGMSITQSLVELMGGKIKVDSLEGKGTTFTVTLPLTIEDIQTPLGQNDKVIEVPNLSTKLVLVADDNRINRAIIQKALHPTKAEIIEAENGQEAFEKAMTCKPDLILMDIRMPILDGIASFKKLKEANFNGPVIAFTANVLKKDIERYISEGFKDCVSKPINVDELYTSISEFLVKENNEI